MTKELYEASKALIDFTKSKYDIKSNDDFYCEHMKKLAIEVDTLNKVASSQLVVGQSEQFICYKADIGNSRCSSQCRECGDNDCHLSIEDG